VSIPFPHIVARGSHRELGRAVGEGAREQIAAAIAFYEEHFTAMAGIPFAEAELQSLAYLPYVKRYLPQYVDELEGMAEAAGLPFVKLLVPNCAEEFTCPADADTRPSPHGGAHFCTGVAVSHAGRHVVGHNMDWYVVDADKNVLFDLTTPDGTRIVTIAGAPYLPILGLNSHGVACIGNSVYSNDNRPGVPNVFIRRWVLEASSMEQAVARACFPVRARGTNYTLADREGRLWDLETSAHAAVLIEGGATLAHTNHYVHPAMAVFEGYHKLESRDRLRQAECELAAGVARGEDARDLVARVLTAHDGGPDAICGHPDETLPVADRVMTVASLICDLDALRVEACAGPPCENEYRVFEAGA
jgi:isopenicillin-N N-acyltransferase-like protein